MGVSKKEISPCPIDVTLSVIDGRWKGTILWRLLDGPMRTHELRKSIPEITERMLLRHLREMTGAGILERHQEQGLPLRVRYSLTAYGRTLVPVLGFHSSCGKRECCCCRSRCQWPLPTRRKKNPAPCGRDSRYAWASSGVLVLPC